MNKFCDYAHDVGSVAKFNIFWPLLLPPLHPRLRSGCIYI